MKMFLQKNILWIFSIFILTRIVLSASIPSTIADDCTHATETSRPCSRIELLNTLTEEFFNLNRYGLRALNSLFVQVLSDDAFYKASNTEHLHQHKAQMWRLIDAASVWLQQADAQADTPVHTPHGRLAKLELLVHGLRLMGEFDTLQHSYNSFNGEKTASASTVLIEQLMKKYGLPQLLEELGILLESFTQNFYKLVEKYLDSLSDEDQAKEKEMLDWYEVNKHEKFGDFGKFFKLYKEEEIF